VGWGKSIIMELIVLFGSAVDGFAAETKVFFGVPFS